MASELLLNLTDREKEGGEMEKGGDRDTKKEKRKKDFKEFSFENSVVLYALLKVLDSKKRAKNISYNFIMGINCPMLLLRRPEERNGTKIF